MRQKLKNSHKRKVQVWRFVKSLYYYVDRGRSLNRISVLDPSPLFILSDFLLGTEKKGEGMGHGH